MSWRLILRGARSCGFCLIRKAYQKAGGLNQAEKDFNFLDPTIVKIYADGSKMGYVGQRVIHLEAGEIPSLYISGKKGATTIGKGQDSEIFYFKHMPDKSNKNWKSMLWQKDAKYINKMSRPMTKPANWHVRSAKTQVSWASAQSVQSLRCALNG